jgi:fumarate hydratase subunit beta
MVIVETPLKGADVEKLKVGDRVVLNGFIYTARDKTHQRIADFLKTAKKLPFDPEGQVIFYTGPTPAKPGRIIGSIGPTTSGRMDAYTPLLLEQGLKGMIGKGDRSEEVRKAIKNHKAIYFAATGGAAALLSQYVVQAEVYAFEDLGPEAIYKLEVKNFPVIVAIDSSGRDLYKEAQLKFQQSS